MTMKRGFIVVLAAIVGVLCATLSGCDQSLPLEAPPGRGADSAAAIDEEEIGPRCPRQGIGGCVRFWEGNFMPPGSSGMITPVERKIYIHEPTRMSDVTQEGDGPFYSEIRTLLVARARSNADGRFFVPLPPGTYSMFVREGDRFYANGFTDEYIYPVIVSRHRMTVVTFDITYLAEF